MITIYHNPKCSKSRATLALLEEKGIEANVVHYLKEPPSAAEIQQICEKLNVHPIEIVRTTEAAFNELGEVGNDDWYQVIADNPILLQRPIVTTDSAAAIGRPPENVLSIL